MFSIIQLYKILYFCVVDGGEESLCDSATLLRVLRRSEPEAQFSLRQLQYWDKTGLLSAARAERGKKRVYGFEDVVRLRIVARLAAGGLPTQRIRIALQRVSAAEERTGRPWHTLRFFTDGHSVFVLNGDNRALDAVRDQFVSLVLLGPLSEETRKVFDSEMKFTLKQSGGR